LVLITSFTHTAIGIRGWQVSDVIRTCQKKKKNLRREGKKEKLAGKKVKQGKNAKKFPPWLK
jgi:hypothetical protein